VPAVDRALRECTAANSVGCAMGARMSELSEKQAKFVAEFLKDHSPPAAALRAGYSQKSGKRLLGVPVIAAEIAKQQSTQAVESIVTLPMLLRESGAALEVAEQSQNASAMVAVIQLRAKLSGQLLDRPGANTGPPAERDHWRRRSADQPEFSDSIKVGQVGTAFDGSRQGGGRSIFRLF